MTLKRRDEIRFYPLLYVVGRIARFFYRLIHWDWRDYTPRPEPPLSELVEQFNGPVYGLVDEFLELVPDGRSYGSGEIGLNYQKDWLKDEDAKPGVSIESRKRSKTEEAWPWLALRIRMAARSAAFEFSSRGYRESEMAQDDGLTDLFGDFRLEAQPNLKVVVAGFSRPTTVWSWSVPEPVFVALLASNETELMISSFGLTLPQFQELPAHIGVINDRPDVMLRYREQADARVKAYERRLGGAQDS
ncbi:MAG: hypothetical protein E6J43_13120 [Chloroflexi bacterium]|nr:MAG: hypothetical protein E6J43_13120 [Chloroflexota bacterium]